jgi:hypothetical protein
MKKFLLVVMCVLFLGTGRSQAGDDWGWRVARTTVDLFIARPFTFAATAIGAGIWAVTLPVTAATKTHKDAFEVMVEQPWQYTVDRPLGDFDE